MSCEKFRSAIIGIDEKIEELHQRMTELKLTLDQLYSMRQLLESDHPINDDILRWLK